MSDYIRLLGHDYADVQALVDAYEAICSQERHSMRPAITDLVLRIGKIYDEARARALREQPIPLMRCSICGESLDDADAIKGDGDGRGQRFAHAACYDNRIRAAR